MAKDFKKEELKMPEESFGVSSVGEVHSSQLGLILGILIVFLMLILAGLFLWGEYLHQTTTPPLEEVPIERPTSEQNNEPESNNAEAQVETMSALSTSDELGTIEADLSGTDVDNITAEETAIEAELEKNN
jgi:cytoskeletal protein RodZ